MNTRLITRITASNDGYSALALRAPLGLIFAAHGAQKLFGWFGGYGLAGTGAWMDSIGLHPGPLMALLAGSTEFFGGLALLIGLLVRPAAAVLAFAMLVAIFSVHIGNGLFMSNNGYEFGLALLAASVSLTIGGAGRLSLDRAIAAGSYRTPSIRAERRQTPFSIAGQRRTPVKKRVFDVRNMDERQTAGV